MSSPARASDCNIAKLIEISHSGDIILTIEHTLNTEAHQIDLRVDTASLKSKSKYFDRLLQPGRFGEGTYIEEQLGTLRQEYSNWADVPTERLPRLRIQDIGRVSTVKSIAPLLGDFFSIIHGRDIQTLPVVNLANIAIVADRFDALDAIKHYVNRKKLIQLINSKTTAKQEEALSEDRQRQRLLIGLLLDHSAWTEKYSARLILRGVVLHEIVGVEALWWDLPGRLEEEIMLRRHYVLQTIQSLQEQFIKAYSSRSRQCRLGYDSSPECDSFQFGEMVRFFLKAGTLRLQHTIFPEDDTAVEYDGDITLLIERLRQIPEYQVDRNHSHCGIRTHLIPSLNLIASALLHIGICGDCWSTKRASYAWLDSKRPLRWNRTGFASSSSSTHERQHEFASSLFTAVEKDWS